VQWFSSECDTNRRSMVVDEIRAREEERHVAQAVSQALELLERDSRAQNNLG